MSEVILRDYQSAAVDMVREGIRAGHRKQVLMSPTGSGKTEIACGMLQEAYRKSSRALFIVDRVVLVDQTSERLDRYKIPHGVQQAQHWRCRPWERIQVCSAQTIEKRGIPEGVSVVFIDEAHCMRKKVSEFIKSTDAVVIGLTATPFTKGMGKLYSNLVNVTTMNKLIADGFLVPLKMYAAKAIDVTGMKVVAGEWSEREIEERGIDIIGDIVAEWADKTEKHFGGPVKTIAFSATVDHGEELCRQFQAAGFNFQQISYKDGGDEHRRGLIEEFRKPDSEIHGLVSCEVFTKGFDVPDVMCGISARPYRKSLSSHMQQLGRIMRASPGKSFGLWLDHCIASGSKVLTHRGLVAIEKILKSDRLWDGHEFVQHKGVVSRGIRPVIQYAGLTATADHPVKTAKGWRTLGQCAEEQEAIVATGFGRSEVRECDGYFTRRNLAWPEDSARDACVMRVRYLWIQIGHCLQQFNRWAHERLPILQSAKEISGMAVSAGSCDETTLQQSEGRRIRELRRTRDQVPFRWSDFWMSLDSRQFGGDGSEQDDAFRSHQQRRKLRARKPSLVDSCLQSISQAWRFASGKRASVQDRASRYSVLGQDALHVHQHRDDGSADRGPFQQAVEKAEREVWDILDAGPRNCFTCQGLLVHNSGNVLRFMADTQDIFESGCTELDDGKREEKAKKEPTEKERNEVRCSCGYILIGFEKVCPSCGKERKRLSMVETLPGQMVELDGKKANKLYTWDQKQAFIGGLRSHAQERGYQPGWVAHQYHNKFGVWPNDPKLRHVPPGPISIDVSNWIRSQQIRFAKSRKTA